MQLKKKKITIIVRVMEKSVASYDQEKTNIEVKI